MFTINILVYSRQFTHYIAFNENYTYYKIYPSKILIRKIKKKSLQVDLRREIYINKLLKLIKNFQTEINLKRNENYTKYFTFVNISLISF